MFNHMLGLRTQGASCCSELTLHGPGEIACGRSSLNKGVSECAEKLFAALSLTCGQPHSVGCEDSNTAGSADMHVADGGRCRLYSGKILNAKTPGEVTLVNDMDKASRVITPNGPVGLAIDSHA